MIKINLLKPKIGIYDDSEPGGIIDIEKLETKYKIKPCLYEVVWDKKEFNEKFGKLKENENEQRNKE